MEGDRYITRRRKFHDFWALALYTIFTLGLTFYLGTKYGFGAEKIKPSVLNLFFYGLALASSIAALNTIGYAFFCEIYLKLMLFLYPLVILTFVLLVRDIKSYILGGISFIFWIISIILYVKYVPHAERILSFAVKILLKNFIGVFLGFIFCALAIIFQIYISIKIDIYGSDLPFFELILASLNFLWSISNFVYFFKVFVSSIVAFHCINYSEDSRYSVIKDSTKNSMYSLGSICFAGFIMEIASTLKLVVSDGRERYFLEFRNIYLVIIQCLLYGILYVLEDIIHFANEFTMPYIATHGKSYMQSLKESHEKIFESSPNSLLGFNTINYSLLITPIHVILFLILFMKSFTDRDLIDLSDKRMLLQVFGAIITPCTLYFLYEMLFSSSYLAVTYLYHENSDVVRNVDSKIYEEFKDAQYLVFYH